MNNGHMTLPPRDHAAATPVRRASLRRFVHWLLLHEAVNRASQLAPALDSPP